MEASILGAVGVVIGAVVTGAIQIVLAILRARRESKRALRSERVEMYKEALWQLRELPRVISAGFAEEREMKELGKLPNYEIPDYGDLFGGIERSIFEVELLGKQEIADGLRAYMDRFADWAMSQDPSKPISGFDAMRRDLQDRETRLLKLMRNNLDLV